MLPSKGKRDLRDLRDLYERCRGCHGTRKLVVAVHIDETRTKSRNAQVGEPCPLGEDGYVTTGITGGQLEDIVERHGKLLVERAKLVMTLKAVAPDIYRLETIEASANDGMTLELSRLRRLKAQIAAAIM